MSEPTLTEPLLADGEEEFIGNINAEARTSSPQTETPDAENHQTNKDLKSSGLRSAFLSGDPSDSQLEYVRDSKLTEESTSSLHAKPQLEYEPTIDDDTSSHPIKTIRVRQPQKIETLSTANEPVCVKCEYCGTACETTVVHVFGLSTCLWICLLLVLCFPIAWLPLFWKDCHDTKHYCTYCSKELGRAKAKSCQFKKAGEEPDDMEDDVEKRVAEAKQTLL